MEITLIRHGKPTLELKGKARANDLKTIIRKYDLSRISEEPPLAAKEKALTCNIAVSSDLNRSIESAMALGFYDINKNER